MGPSHFFVLLLAISACAYGMNPSTQAFGRMLSNIGLQSGMSQAGLRGGLSVTGGQSMTGGLTMPGQQTMAGEFGMMSGPGLTGGLEMSGGQGMTGGLTMPGGQGVTGRLTMPGGQGVTGRLTMPGGQSMTGGFGMTGGSQLIGRGGRNGAMVAMQYPLYEWKRNQLKNLIKLYEKHGCIDPMQKFSSEFMLAAVTMISGCSHVMANNSCRQYGAQKVNLQTVLFQNSMSSTYQSRMATRMQNMSPYNSLKDYILGTIPQNQMTPAHMRLVYGNEGPGSGLAFAGERLDRLKNMRMRLLPYQCQDVRHGSLTMGMCCPGPDLSAATQQTGTSNQPGLYPSTSQQQPAPGAGAAGAPGTGAGAGTGTSNAYPNPSTYLQAQGAASDPYTSANSVYQQQAAAQAALYSSQRQPQYNPQAALYGQQQSQYGQQQQSAMYGQPQYGQTQQSSYPGQYGQQYPQSLQYGQQTPQYGQQTSQYGQQTPQYGQQTPQYGQQTPQYGKTPQYGQQTSQYGQQTPQYGQQTPQYGQQTLQYGQQQRYGQPQYRQYPGFGTSNQNSPYASFQQQHGQYPPQRQYSPWGVNLWQTQPRTNSFGSRMGNTMGTRMGNTMGTRMGNTMGTTMRTGAAGQQGGRAGRQRMNPLTGYMHERQLKWKENLNQNIMSQYKNRYGCKEAMNYVSGNVRFAVAKDFVNGCTAAANATCQITTMNRNPSVYINRRILPPFRLQQIETALNSMDPYTLAQRLNPTPGPAGQRGQGGGGGLGALAGIGAMPGGGGGGVLQRAIGGLMIREIAGMELPDAREKYLPFQCQEIGTSPRTKIGMCCPGAVEILPQHQNLMFAGLV